MHNFNLLQKGHIFTVNNFFNYKTFPPIGKWVKLVEEKTNLGGSLSSERDQYYYIGAQALFVGGFQSS